MSCCIYQCAYDAVLLSRHLYYNIAVDMLQRDSLAVMDWYHSSLITVIPNKSKICVFSEPSESCEFECSLLLHGSCFVPFSCVAMEYVDPLKYLGVF